MLFLHQFMLLAARDVTVKSVLGEKSAMAAHLAGGTNGGCPNASDAAKAAARAIRAGGTEENSDSDPGPPRKKAKRTAQQAFTDEQVAAIQAQFLRATVSANLPFRWVEDPEIIRLFLMFRSLACDVIPSRLVISTRLLNAASAEVETMLRNTLTGKYYPQDRWLEGRIQELDWWSKCIS